MTSVPTPSVRQRKHQLDHPDHIAWAGRLTVAGYGAVIALRASEAAVLPALRRMVPPGARAGASGTPDVEDSVVVRRRGAQRVFRPSHRLYEGTECVCESDSLEAVLTTLESTLQFKLACCARTRLFVHAGVVAWRGRAILVPGRTRSGKSTLIAALVRAGATYYSDEYAVLDDEGLVHPFARPLGIRDALGRTRLVSAASFGAVVGNEPAPVRLVVATRHVPRARWRPNPMSPGETVLALLDNTLAARSRPADAIRILSAVAQGAHALRGARGEADRVVDRILSSCSHAFPSI